MDAMMGIALGALGGAAYGMVGWFNQRKDKEGTFDVKKFLPVVVYGLVVGAAAVLLMPEAAVNEQAAFTLGTTGSVIIQKLLGAF